MKQQSTLKNFDQADQALFELAQQEAFIRAQEARMNEEQQRIREEYEHVTAEARQKKLALEKDLELFCIENKTEFEKQRTRELTHGIIGFRTTPPRVSLLNRKYNWGTVIELLKRIAFGKRYIRVIEEIDKEKILADVAAQEIDDKKLAAVGLKVDQTEKFIYDIKWDTIQD